MKFSERLGFAIHETGESAPEDKVTIENLENNDLPPGV